MFADDSYIISGPIDMLHEIIVKLENDLNCIYNWMDNNRLELNVEKTLIMYIGSRSVMNKFNEPIVKINGISIRRVNSMKVLGIIVDDCLNFNQHTNIVAKKC